MYKKNIPKPVNPEKKRKKKTPIIPNNDNFLKFMYNNKKIMEDDKDKNIKDKK